MDQQHEIKNDNMVFGIDNDKMINYQWISSTQDNDIIFSIDSDSNGIPMDQLNSTDKKQEYSVLLSAIALSRC